jgi:hypothetical protein
MKFGPMDLNSIYFIEFKRRFRVDIGSKFEWTRINWIRNNFFQKWKAMILKRLRRSFGFKIESKMDLNERGRFLHTPLNLKQYSITKINA